MDVNKIMTESFDMLLNRDKNLNQIVHDSANLRNDSKDVSGPMGSFSVCSKKVFLKLGSVECTLSKIITAVLLLKSGHTHTRKERLTCCVLFEL